MLDDDVRVQGWRLGVLVVVIFAAVDVLLSRLWTVQIVNSASAQQRSQAQTTVKARIAPARGAICDRNGVALAENRPSFDIDFYLDDLRRDYAQSHHGRVPLLKMPPGKNGKHRPDEPDIVEIVKESIQPISDTLNLSAPLNEKDIREHFRTERDLPYHYMTNLDFAEVANFKERNFGVRGIDISQSPQRSYPLGAFASHILGYVGSPRNQEEHLASDGTPYEMVGRQGIEALMDAQLQGEPGSVIRRVSSQGYYIGEPLEETDPTVGNSLYLTIDARVQYIAETALRSHNVGRGAVVVMDPRNGDVLALASVPDYDPNKFIPRVDAKTWDALNNDPTEPLYDRATHGYEPGSTYKIMVALAGLKSGHVTVNTDFDCPAAIQIGDHLFHNSDRADGGTMSLVNAIRVSSDVFFYQYGIRAGIEAIDSMAKKAGFGQKWGILGENDEDAGIVPGPEWMTQNEAWLKRTHNVDRWSNAQTANTAIGQGYVLCSPLQMTTFLCAVANGGTVYRPRLYSHVTNYKGDTIADIPDRQVFSTLDVRSSNMKAVQQGMLEVVQNGTATLAQVPGYNIAGKTGTAQAYIRLGGERKQDLKCWFYCFGPFENPRYVTCVLVEGGTWGGTTTAPIAQEIMKRLFAMDAGAVENVAALTPVVGNFNGATEPEVHDDGPAIKPAAAGAPNADGGDNDTTPAADAPPGARATRPSYGTKRAR
jgi:penicillin-binding protein 2